MPTPNTKPDFPFLAHPNHLVNSSSDFGALKTYCSQVVKPVLRHFADCMVLIGFVTFNLKKLFFFLEDVFSCLFGSKKNWHRDGPCYTLLQYMVFRFGGAISV